MTQVGGTFTLPDRSSMENRPTVKNGRSPAKELWLGRQVLAQVLYPWAGKVNVMVGCADPVDRHPSAC